MTAFDLGRILYEAAIREAWGFGSGYAERKLAAEPYPRHPADPDPRCDSARVQISQAQARALLKVCSVEPLPSTSPVPGGREP